MSFQGLMFVAVACFCLSLLATSALTWASIPLLRRLGRVDYPNERSSHSQPVLRGGGIGIVPVLVVPIAINVWLLSEEQLRPPLVLLAGFVLLCIVSWLDDRKSVPAGVRLLVQAGAVAVGSAALPSSFLLFQGSMPELLDRIVVCVAWVWFINLYNFMDGIDGITGVETASIGFGIFIIALAAGLPWPLLWLALAIAGAACGFLVWNWAPAKVFLGDVGSVPLGYILGFLLFILASDGYIMVALILPLYYLMDATFTLVQRALAGEAFWRAHRTHAYQVAAAATSHDFVVKRILVLNIVLAGLALAAVRLEWPVVTATALLVGVALTAALIVFFRRLGFARAP